MFALASRNMKEILRDPLNLAFGLGFPVAVLLLLTFIQSNLPVAMFELDRLVPGIAVFGLSFISLFSGMLIARDRTSSLMLRMFASPLTAFDFILAYTLPLLPIAVAQVAVSYITAIILGLKVTVDIVGAILLTIPAAVFFIAIGLLCGSVLTDRQVGGVCGALLTNVGAWLSGTWFDLSLVGEGFKNVAYALPFAHAVDVGRAALAGNYSAVFPGIWWVTGYAVITAAFAVLAFTRSVTGKAQ